MTTTTAVQLSTVMQDIFRPYDEGHPAILLTGRSLRDLVVDDDGVLRPLGEAIGRVARDVYGLHLVRYCMATGLDANTDLLPDSRDRETITTALRVHGLCDVPQDQNEVVRVMRGVAALGRTPTTGLHWAAAGRPLRFVFLLEFAEHLTPGTLTNGTQRVGQLVAVELAHLTAQSLALRASGNLLLLHGREGLVDPLVIGAVRHVRLCQPDQVEKAQFMDAALKVYSKATLAPSLTRDVVVHLSANTPNRSLEQQLRASHRTGKPLTAASLAAQKTRDVEVLSEGTLAVLDTRRVDGVLLEGRNVAVVRRVLERYADGLLRGDPATPSNLLLCGAPGTGKTDLALILARSAQAASYRMVSPKASLVGETERRAALQQAILREWTPNVAFIDEISEAFPLERNDFDGDSGATRAVMATLLTALSDETRRGLSIVVGTTNCPWRIGAAMRSRWTVVPIISPLAEDYPVILASTARRIASSDSLVADAPRLVRAAEIFFAKGASPRHMRAALSQAIVLHGALSDETVLMAAVDFCGSADRASTIYADLWALHACSSRSFFPWSDDPGHYPYPDYLDGIVDVRTGELDRTALESELNRLRKVANV